MKQTNRRMGPIVLLALSFTMLGVAGCSAGKASSSPDGTPLAQEGSTGSNETVATVGGTPISRQQLVGQLLESYGAQTLRTLMLRIAVDREAEEKGIEVTEDDIARELRRMSQGYDSEEQFYASLLEQLGMGKEEVRRDVIYRLKLEQLAILPVVVSDEEIAGYIEENAEEFGPRSELRISHIVVQSNEVAEEVLKRLEGGEDFSTLAMEYSSDEFTQDAGGDLGWVSTGDPFVASGVLDTAESLEIGQAAGPVETENGIELVQLTGRNVVQAMDSEEARDRARRELALQNSISMSELEEQLLNKYEARILESGLQP